MHERRSHRRNRRREKELHMRECTSLQKEGSSTVVSQGANQSQHKRAQRRAVLCQGACQHLIARKEPGGTAAPTQDSSEVTTPTSHHSTLWHPKFAVHKGACPSRDMTRGSLLVFRVMPRDTGLQGQSDRLDTGRLGRHKRFGCHSAPHGSPNCSPTSDRKRHHHSLPQLRL